MTGQVEHLMQSRTRRPCLKIKPQKAILFLIHFKINAFKRKQTDLGNIEITKKEIHLLFTVTIYTVKDSYTNLSTVTLLFKVVRCCNQMTHIY